jgi:signal transduction histidine kinase
MSLGPFFRKYFILTVLVFAVVLMVCDFAAHYFERFGMERFFETQADAIFEQIEKHGSGTREYIGELNQLHRQMHSPLRIVLLPNEETERPHGPMKTKELVIDGQTASVAVVAMGPPPHGGRPPPSPPGEPFDHRPPPGGPMHVFDGPPPLRFVGFAFVVFAILLASATSIFLIYRSFKEKAELAKTVLHQMQHGDLKVRFPISKWDESSQIFGLYNKMADEIERLVDRLRQNEQTRVTLLQELAHDLRTPVSSLHSVIETLNYDEAKLDEQSKSELKSVALHEVEYLKRLVEDLLFLALVLEPRYKVESEEIAVSDLLLNEMNAVNASYTSVRAEFIDRCDSRTLTLGSPHSLRRMFRNIYDNAFSFAKSRVMTTLIEQGDQIQILIQDDGPGLSRAAIESFGKKRSSTRYAGANSAGRISIGLGSMIIHTIAAAHGGSISIRNVLGSDGQILGAELSLTLPIRLKAVA